MSSMVNSSNPTPRTRVVREPQRAVYDRDAVNQILDEAFLCHVGFAVEGQPYVIPTSYGRDGDVLYIHGSAASRMLRNLDQGIAVCVTVTLIDGLVMARSVFNHSMNYRSVVILGAAKLVVDPAEKLAALRVLSEHILPQRWDDSRQPNEKELKATSVLRLPIREFSAKVRVGPPIDDEEDYSFPTWAGVIPLEMKDGRGDSRRALRAGDAGLSSELLAEEEIVKRADESGHPVRSATAASANGYSVGALLESNSPRSLLNSRHEALSLWGLWRPSAMKRRFAAGNKFCACFISCGSVRGSCFPCRKVTGTCSALNPPSYKSSLGALWAARFNQTWQLRWIVWGQRLSPWSAASSVRAFSLTSSG